MFSDISSHIVDQASMKSKSPVSLEVYMPSTAGKYSKISFVIWPFVDLQLYEKLLVRNFSSRYEKFSCL